MMHLPLTIVYLASCFPLATLTAVSSTLGATQCLPNRRGDLIPDPKDCDGIINFIRENSPIWPIRFQHEPPDRDDQIQVPFSWISQKQHRGVRCRVFIDLKTGYSWDDFLLRRVADTAANVVSQCLRPPIGYLPLAGAATVMPRDRLQVVVMGEPANGSFGKLGNYTLGTAALGSVGGAVSQV